MGMCGSDTPGGPARSKALMLKATRRLYKNYRPLRWASKRSMILMTRRRVLQEGLRKPMNGAERKVRALQKLVANGKSMSLDGLFKEAANYIMYLEMQVRVMQVMVNVLSGPNE